MSRSHVIVGTSSLDDEINLTMEVEGGDMQAAGWISMGQAKDMARKILGLVEDWERMRGED